MAEIIGLVATIVNAILTTTQTYIKKVEDGVQAPFKKGDKVDAETQTPIKRRCELRPSRLYERLSRPDS
jgi:hypothetical protein